MKIKKGTGNREQGTGLFLSGIARGLLAVAMVAVGMSAFAAPSVTINEVKTAMPWDSTKGAITVDYSLSELVADGLYKVAFDIAVNGETQRVSNAAAKLVGGRQEVKTINTVELFGKEAIDAEVKVKITLFATQPEPDLGGVQLWDDGPYFAECNVGAEKPEDYGWHFWWGGTIGYVWNGYGVGWASVVDGTIIQFGECAPANSTYNKTRNTLISEGWVDENGNLKPEHDAATVHLGAPWRMMTYAELQKLADRSVCQNEWVQNYKGTGINGCLVTGLTEMYTDKSIFLPAAGGVSDTGTGNAGRYGSYWSSTDRMNDGRSAGGLSAMSGMFAVDDKLRYCGDSVRPVRGPAEKEAVAFAEAECRLGPVSYRAWNETARMLEDRVCSDYTVVTSATATFEDGQWYVVEGEVTTTDLKVNGTAHLILVDGATLTANGATHKAGIEVRGGNALTVYCQSAGTGKLVAAGGSSAAGIGGDLKAVNGDITINGGIVTAGSAGLGAGIGGGRYCNQWSGAPIGTITINGGTVTATGGEYGAGIGSGPDGSGGPVTINGGNVAAKGGDYGAGIGGGGGNGSLNGGDVTINGGTVEAVAGSQAVDIGGGYGNGSSVGDPGTLTINGGSVKYATGAVPKNDANEAVYCVTVEGLEGLVYVKGLADYGVQDIYPINGKVYLWLPNGSHEFTIGSTVYSATVEDANTTATIVPPEVSINAVKSGDPWDATKGAITVGYAFAGIGDGLYKVAFDITANGETASVTNGAEKLVRGQSYVKAIDTVALFGREVTDKEAKVKVSLIAVPMPGVQLWEDGPYFAERNLGAAKPEESGWYFWWGDTVGYKRNEADTGWNAVDGSSKGYWFNLWNCPTYDHDNVWLKNNGWIDGSGNLKPAHDAAMVCLGAPWRMMTRAEAEKLVDTTVCERTWVSNWNGSGKGGYVIKGKGAYASNSIFFPKSGYGNADDLYNADSGGYCWVSTSDSNSSTYAWRFIFPAGLFCADVGYRYMGLPVRAVRDTPTLALEKEVVATAEAEFVLGPSGVTVTVTVPTGVIATIGDTVLEETGDVTLPQGPFTVVYTAAEGYVLKGDPVEKEHEANDGETIDDNEDLEAAEAVCAFDERKFGSLTEAVLHAIGMSGKTVRFLKDITETVNNLAGGTITLDLAGHTLTGSLYAHNAGNVTVSNGTVTCDGEYTVRADLVARVVVGDGAKIVNTNVKGVALDVLDGCEAVVEEGAEIESDDVGIYMRNYAAESNTNRLTVSGGTVTAANTAVVIETGSPEDGVDTGLTFSIVGGTFTSDGPAVVNFVREGAAPVEPGISGGLFKAKPADELLVDGLVWVEADDGYWTPGERPDDPPEETGVARLDGVCYDTVEAAFEAASDGDTVELISTTNADTHAASDSVTVMSRVFTVITPGVVRVGSARRVTTDGEAEWEDPPSQPTVFDLDGVEVHLALGAELALDNVQVAGKVSLSGDGLLVVSNYTGLGRIRVRIADAGEMAARRPVAVGPAERLELADTVGELVQEGDYVYWQYDVFAYSYEQKGNGIAFVTVNDGGKVKELAPVESKVGTCRVGYVRDNGEERELLLHLVCIDYDHAVVHVPTDVETKCLVEDGGWKVVRDGDRVSVDWKVDSNGDLTFLFDNQQRKVKGISSKPISVGEITAEIEKQAKKDKDDGGSDLGRAIGGVLGSAGIGGILGGIAAGIGGGGGGGGAALGGAIGGVALADLVGGAIEGVDIPEGDVDPGPGEGDIEPEAPQAPDPQVAEQWLESWEKFAKTLSKFFDAVTIAQAVKDLIVMWACPIEYKGFPHFATSFESVHRSAQKDNDAHHAIHWFFSSSIHRADFLGSGSVDISADRSMADFILSELALGSLAEGSDFARFQDAFNWVLRVEAIFDAIYEGGVSPATVGGEVVTLLKNIVQQCQKNGFFDPPVNASVTIPSGGNYTVLGMKFGIKGDLPARPRTAPIIEVKSGATLKLSECSFANYTYNTQKGLIHVESGAVLSLDATTFSGNVSQDGTASVVVDEGGIVWLYGDTAVDNLGAVRGDVRIGFGPYRSGNPVSGNLTGTVYIGGDTCVDGRIGTVAFEESTGWDNIHSLKRDRWYMPSVRDDGYVYWDYRPGAKELLRPRFAPPGFSIDMIEKPDGRCAHLSGVVSNAWSSFYYTPIGAKALKDQFGPVSSSTLQPADGKLEISVDVPVGDNPAGFFNVELSDVPLK